MLADQLRSRAPQRALQADVTAWQLASGEVVEIIDLIDGLSRLHLGCDAYERVKAVDVVASLHKAAALHGLPPPGGPASTLDTAPASACGAWRPYEP